MKNLLLHPSPAGGRGAGGEGGNDFVAFAASVFGRVRPSPLTPLPPAGEGNCVPLVEASDLNTLRTTFCGDPSASSLRGAAA